MCSLFNPIVIVIHYSLSITSANKDQRFLWHHFHKISGCEVNKTILDNFQHCMKQSMSKRQIYLVRVCYMTGSFTNIMISSCVNLFKYYCCHMEQNSRFIGNKIRLRIWESDTWLLTRVGVRNSPVKTTNAGQEWRKAEWMGRQKEKKRVFVGITVSTQGDVYPDWRSVTEKKLNYVNSCEVYKMA